MALHKKLCRLAQELSRVFSSGLPFEESKLVQEYHRCLGRNLSWRNYDCATVGDLLKKLPIFVRCETNSDFISFDKSKLLEFLFGSVLHSQDGAALPFAELLTCFKEVTGLGAEFVFEILGVEDLNSDVSVLASKLISITNAFGKRKDNKEWCLVFRNTVYLQPCDAMLKKDVETTRPGAKDIEDARPGGSLNSKKGVEKSRPVKKDAEKPGMHTSSEVSSMLPRSVPRGAVAMKSVPELPAVPEKHPNPCIEVARETFLPSHALFRPELDCSIVKVSKKSFPRNESKSDRIKRINSHLEDFIQDISSKNKFVPLYIVRRFVSDLLQREKNRGIPHQSELTIRDIPAYEKQSKVYGRIEELIKVFCWFNTITSLHELELAVMSSEHIDCFESLCIGPLQKHPRVCDLFKPPQGIDSIPQITSYHIQNYLMKFLNKSKRGSKHSLEEFLEFMRSMEFVESAHHLCVRISSFPLAIQTNFRFRTVQRLARERTEKAIEEDVRDILEHETKKLQRKLATSVDDPLSIRKEIANKDPVVILEGIFNACAGHFSGRLRARVLDFLQLVTATPQLRHLFLMSILEGAYGADKLLPELYVQSSSQPQPAGVQHEYLFRKAPGEVWKEVLHHLHCIPFPIDLSSLSRVEGQITEHFNAPTFDSLGNGSFLHFLSTNSKGAEALGGNLIGSLGSRPHVISIKSKVVSIISQLKPEQRQNKEVVTKAITTEFGVVNYEDVGCGNLEKVLADIEQTSEIATISYLTPIILNGYTDSSQSLHMNSVGFLGHQTPDGALARLCSAPLLEDLVQWSLWDLVYKPQFGSLTDFLRTVARGKEDCLHVLQIAPNKLLRISQDSSSQDFTTAINPENPDPISASGHLVSMIVKRGSIHEIPLQLFANQMKAALGKMMASVEGEQNLETVSLFVYHCMIRIPLEICWLVAKELFLDPLRTVSSSSVVDNLLSYCQSVEHRRFMQSLGMKIGVVSWGDDFQKEHTNEIPLWTNSMKQVVSHEVLLKQQKTPPDVEANTTVTTEHTPISTIDKEHYQPKTAEELSKQVADCKAVIEGIRVEEFGVGIVLDEEQSKVAQKQRLREGRSLQRLSLELYSKDTHFVLELIQNADDNNYPLSLMSEAAEEVPSLKFVISSKSITVFNNESGFSEQNVRAICDVGKSTKGVHRSGYIGQKGIGFKSVFRITDTPQIHSNGFHIMFDASSDPIGYILPHWIETVKQQSIKWSTQIVLPLKQDLHASNLAKKFYDVQPSLLLFLHRLRSKTRHMTRKDKHHGVVEIHHNHATDRWLVIRRELNEAKKFKADVEVTELALAFPLPADKKSISLAKDLQHQQVFAFLPLRSYGFRFIVQADFDLPSSREDVNVDSAWNQWLREEIPTLFVDALQMIKEQPGVSDLQAVALFLQFVPLEGELHDFFLLVSRQIISRIKGTECLPTDPVQKTDVDLLTLMEPYSNSAAGIELENIEWKQPSQLLFVSEKYCFIRKHIPQSLLATTLNLSYLNATLLSSINSSLQQQLGISNITNDHLREVALAVLTLYQKECIESNSDDYSYDFDEDADSERSDHYLSEKLTPSFTNWIAKWLACVHIIIEDTNDIGVIEKLKTVPIIPLENGTFISASGCSLFFPPDGETKDSEAFKEIFKEVNVVASLLFKQEDDLTQSRVRRVLEMFGVKNLYPSDIIKHHILPIFTTGSWKQKSDAVLSTYLIYIKECIDRRGSGVTETDMVRLLKDCVVVITNEGPKLPSKDVVHFSKHYKCDPDLQTNFPEVKWTVVSKAYVRRSSTVDSICQWRIFFSKLGVKKGIAVKRVTDKTLAEDSEILKLQDFRRLPPGPYIFNDWESEEFVEIVKSVQHIKNIADKQARMKKLIELLDKHWDDEYHKYVQAQICDSSGCAFPVPSSFKTSLVTLSWVPPSNTNSPYPLYRGCDLYDQSKRIHTLLDSHVPYVGAELKNSNFVQLLGIKQDVSAIEVLAYLREWYGVCQETDKPFVTPIEHLLNVYIYLKGEIEKELLGNESVILDAMKTEELIFVPDKYETDSEDRFVFNKPMPGHFYSVHKLCWIDPTTVLYFKQKHNKKLPKILPKVLQLYYGVTAKTNSQIQQAFAHFGVPETPLTTSLISLLKYISTESATPEPIEVKNFTNVVLHLAKLGSDGVTTPTFIRSNLQQACVFPTHDHKWVSLESILLENDDQQMAKLFVNSEKLHFLQWPQELLAKSKSSRQTSEYREAFLQICQIKKLTTVVYPRIDKEFGETRPIDELQEKMNLYTNLIQCFLFTHCKKQYNMLTSCKLQTTLMRLQILSKLKLECRYVITHDNGEIVSSVASQVPCEYVDSEDPPVIYVSASKIKLVALLPALMKLFMTDGDENEKHEFSAFLMDLIVNEPCNEEIEEFFKKHNLVALPDEDAVWVVPLPISKKQPRAIEAGETESELEFDTEDESDVKEAAEQSTCQLKSWPPKASVDFIEHSQQKVKRISKQDIQEQSDTDAKNVITEEDIQEARKKHFGISDNPTASFKSDTEKTITMDSDGSGGKLPPTSNEPEQKVHRKHVSEDSTTHLEVTSSRDEIAPKHAAMQKFNPQHSQLHLEDIQSFVQSTESSLNLIALIPDDEPESQSRTGRWGEEFVYKLLKSKGFLPDGRKFQNITWVNQHQESGKPFDVEVQVSSEQVFIEVKSTSADQEELVAMSLNELKFAEHQHKNFYLYRVYNAGKLSHRLALLGNFYEHLEKNSVRFFFKL